MAERKLKAFVLWPKDHPRSMPCPECGSTTTVCARCHASIQATVRGALPPKQQELKL